MSQTIRTPRRGSRRGFTLIEILLVVTIIGLTTAFVAPKIDIMRYRVDGSMQQIGTTFLAAQRLAVSRQHDVVVAFDVPGRAIRVHDDANNDGAVDNDEHVAAMPIGETIAFGRGAAPQRPAGPGPVTFTKVVDGFPAVVFHRDGSASSAGAIYLTSQRAVASSDHLTDARVIEIERATGRTSWYRYAPAGWRRGF